jgi:hypothetical protein
MLRNSKNLKGFTIHARDGELGTVDQLYFDDKTWTVRYLTVDTGGWLSGRSVLISPISILHTDWEAIRLDVVLTQKQVEHSPDIDTHQPVSRQREAEYFGYYGYPSYWSGPYLWGPGYYPAGLLMPEPLTTAANAGRAQKESADSHLRSSAEVTGYNIETADGEIGHIAGFVIDDESWSIRYIEVATRNWWPGKKVLISPVWIEKVNWANSEVTVAVSCEAIRSAPEYVDDMTINRTYENLLHQHYGQPAYWLHAARTRASF